MRKSSVSVTLPKRPDLEAATGELLDQVAYRGPGSVQLIERDGEVFVHDMNLRLVYSVGAAVAAGLDMPRLAVDDALGRVRPGEVIRVEEELHYVWLTGELRNLANGVRRRSPEEPPGRIAADLVLAALSPRRVLDPFDLTDPVPLIATLTSGIRRAGRAT